MQEGELPWYRKLDCFWRRLAQPCVIVSSKIQPYIFFPSSITDDEILQLLYLKNAVILSHQTRIVWSNHTVQIWSHFYLIASKMFSYYKEIREIIFKSGGQVWWLLWQITAMSTINAFWKCLKKNSIARNCLWTILFIYWNVYEILVCEKQSAIHWCWWWEHQAW